MSRIRRYSAPCQCSGSRLIPYKYDMTDYPVTLTLQLSDLCQANCAFCPQDHDGKNSLKKYWDELEQVFVETKCKLLSVEGGEILIQSDTMQWLRRMKMKHNFTFQILTNGCVGSQIARNASDLFSRVLLSMGGFSDQTYRNVLGMNFERVLQFAQIVNEKVGVHLAAKYLISPSSLHELPLFMGWALSNKIPEIILAHITFPGAEIDYKIAYWDKVVKNVRAANRKVFSRYPDAHKETVLSINGPLMDVTLIDEDILSNFETKFWHIL